MSWPLSIRLRVFSIFSLEQRTQIQKQGCWNVSKIGHTYNRLFFSHFFRQVRWLGFPKNWVLAILLSFDAKISLSFGIFSWVLMFCWVSSQIYLFLLHKNSFLASSELRFSEKLSFEGTKSLSFDNFWLSFWKAWVLMPLSFEPNCETKSLPYWVFHSVLNVAWWFYRRPFLTPDFGEWSLSYAPKLHHITLPAM